MHKHNYQGDTFTSTVTKKSYEIRSFLNCDSHNILYLVTCLNQNCGQQYIGQTGRRHKDRTSEHLHSIKNLSIETPIALHFRLPGHSIEHFSTQAVEQCSRNDVDFRETREKYWMNVLQTAINKK